ncbi:MAG TPA: DUF4129 domain-containing protein [Anaerolineales bacterium]|nr:DUF4129 domain-containing protein [Anaerolineales bacterium]
MREPALFRTTYLRLTYQQRANSADFLKRIIAIFPHVGYSLPLIRYRWAVWLILCGLLFGNFKQAQAQTPPIQRTANEILLLIAQTQTWLAQSPLPDVQAQPFLADWRATRSVRLPDGTALVVDFTPLVSALTAVTPDSQAIQAYLEKLSQAVQQPSKADALNQLQEILQKPEFTYYPSTDSQNGREFWERVAGFISMILHPFFEFGVRNPLLMRGLLIGLGIGVVVGVLSYVGYLLAKNSTTSTTLSPEEAIERGLLSGVQASQQAQTFMEAGDMRQAVRYLYLSALLFLQERDFLRFDRSLTNREYLNLVRHSPELFQRLSAVVSVFDRVWYGYETLSNEDFAQYRQLALALREQNA